MADTSDEEALLPLMSQGSFENLCQQVGQEYQTVLDDTLRTEDLHSHTRLTNTRIAGDDSRPITSSAYASRTQPAALSTYTAASTAGFIPSYEAPGSTAVTWYTAPSSTAVTSYTAPSSTAVTSYTAPSTTAYTTSTYTNPITAFSTSYTKTTTSNLLSTSSFALNTANVSGGRYPRPTSIPPIVRQISTSVDDGGLEFQIEIPQLAKQTKSVAWTYSEVLKKLYIQMQTPFKLTARISATSAAVTHPDSLFLRAVPMFTDKQHREDPVHACFTHSHQDSSSGIYRRDPWMQSGKGYLPTSVDSDERGHFTLVTPWQSYSRSMEIAYQFVCRNVCVGGPNRRHTSVAFTLESQSGEVLARKVIEVKVSACPGRDRSNDEKALMNSTVVKTEPSRKRVHFENRTGGQSNKQLSDGSTKKRKFYLEMEDEDTYSLLSQLRDSIELSKRISPEMKQKYLSSSTYTQIVSPTSSTATTNAPSQLLSPTSNIDPTIPPSPHQTCTRHVSTNTRRPSTGSPPLLPDSSGECTHTDDVKVSEWLPSIGLGAYVDSFINAGIVSVNQIGSLSLKDFDKLHIGLPHVFMIMENLADFFKGEPLSQASQSESYGLYEVTRSQSQLSGYSSED